MTTRHRDGVSEMYQSMCKQLLACQNNSKHNPTECFPDATEGPSVCRSCTPDEPTTEAPPTPGPIVYWAENNFFTFFYKLSNKPIFVVECYFVSFKTVEITVRKFSYLGKNKSCIIHFFSKKCFLAILTHWFQVSIFWTFFPFFSKNKVFLSTNFFDETI